MQVLLRALLYFYLLTIFATSYFIIIDLDAVGLPLFFAVWVSGALIMGWIGDAVLFRRGTVFGRNEFGLLGRNLYLAFIVLAPLAAMISEN